MTNVMYLISALCFIGALRGLASAQTSRLGNWIAIFGMLIAIVGVCIKAGRNDFALLFGTIGAGAAIGNIIALRVSMVSLPQMVAGFHSLVGLSAVLVACAVFCSPHSFGILENGNICISGLVEMGLGVAIGAITFTGSLIAFLKLQGLYKGHNISRAFNFAFGSGVICLLIYFIYAKSLIAFVLLACASMVLGATLVIPIGGADMPVVVSLLNSYSGWAASGIGFTLHNDLLIITGALVGASGAILSYIMCKGMNRSLLDVIFSTSFGGGATKSQNVVSNFHQGMPEDIACMLASAQSVIIVPGYGMATSKAQHALKELGDTLKKRGVSVRYAIHPVAGRMPGHMNVLLAEADVPYDEVFELDEINGEFSSCDVAYVIGANDITNPAAKTDPGSPIYGMPILEVSRAKAVVFLKRSMGVGYAGVDNSLFYAENTIMLLGDAKKNTEEVVRAL